MNASYPNPFNPSTNIGFQLPGIAKVSLAVYDVLGRKVSVLIDGQPMSAGHHVVRFDGSDLASGMYFYRLTAGEFSEVGKMVLMK